MKILAIIGSPRKKKCFEFSKMIEENLKKEISCEFEYLFLNEANLKYCRGCGLCLTDEKKCPIKDDFLIILEKLKKSDFTIFASPVYSYHESALIKNFFDRFHFLHFRPIFLNVFAVNLIISNYSGIKGVTKYLNYTSRSWGYQIIKNIGISNYLYNTNQKYKKRIDNEIAGIVRKFLYLKSNNKRINPCFYDFLLFKDKKILIKNYKNKYPIIYKYWEEKKYLERYYYYKVCVNPLSRLFLMFKNLDLSES